MVWGEGVQEVAAQEAGDIGADLGVGDGVAGVLDELVLGGEDIGDQAFAVGPLVEELVEDAGVGVLGDEGGAEELEAFGGHLGDDRGVVEEPPAAEEFEVAELAGGDAQLVLGLAAEHGDEESVVGEGGAEAGDGGGVGFAEHVAGVAEGGVDAHDGADHHGEGQVVVAADGEDNFFEDAGGGGVGVGGAVAEGGREADGAVDGFHALDPVVEEAAGLVEAVVVGGWGGGVAEFGEGLRGGGPVGEEFVETEDGRKAGVGADGGVGEPACALIGIEDVVGHGDAADGGFLHHEVDVLVYVLFCKPLAVVVEVFFVGVESELGEGGEDASGGLAEGGAA